MSDERSDDGVFTVVVNDEEQYSIWPAGRALPAGWRETGAAGDKAECLGHIAEAWADMRPRSVRGGSSD
ncbi:MAG TPA: MbtH family protein [Rugosimonospora sp.]|nr:MbtH family protein [Rugosimonospora sp.]